MAGKRHPRPGCDAFQQTKGKAWNDDREPGRQADEHMERHADYHERQHGDNESVPSLHLSHLEAHHTGEPARQRSLP